MAQPQCRAGIILGTWDSEPNRGHRDSVVTDTPGQRLAESVRAAKLLPPVCKSQDTHSLLGRPSGRCARSPPLGSISSLASCPQGPRPSAVGIAVYCNSHPRGRNLETEISYCWGHSLLQVTSPRVAGGKNTEGSLEPLAGARKPSPHLCSLGRRIKPMWPTSNGPTSALRRKDVLIHAPPWTSLEDRRQTQKCQNHVVPRE